MPKTSPKSVLGNEKKADRQKANFLISSLKGKDIRKMTPSALAILLGVSDKNGIVR